MDRSSKMHVFGIKADLMKMAHERSPCNVTLATDSCFYYAGR